MKTLSILFLLSLILFLLNISLYFKLQKIIKFLNYLKTQNLQENLFFNNFDKFNEDIYLPENWMYDVYKNDHLTFYERLNDINFD